MRGVIHGMLLISCLLPSCACAKLASLGPTPLDEGVILYVHDNFAGTSQAVNVDVPELQKVEGPCGASAESSPTWNDCVSSIRVLPGWAATIYEDPDYKGKSLEITADTIDLRSVTGPCKQGFNDCMSSLKVHTH